MVSAAPCSTAISPKFISKSELKKSIDCWSGANELVSEGEPVSEDATSRKMSSRKLVEEASCGASDPVSDVITAVSHEESDDAGGVIIVRTLTQVRCGSSRLDALPLSRLWGLGFSEQRLENLDTTQGDGAVSGDGPDR